VTDSLLKADGLINHQLELERLQWVIKHQVMTDETKRTGLGDIDKPRLQKSIELLAMGLGLPSVVPVDKIWTDKYLPDAATRRVT
jgi:NitT/TauT family transport system substrate-binding protein